MTNIIILIITGLIGLTIGTWLGKRRMRANGFEKANQERAEVKNERKEKILELFASQSKIRNDEVQKLLNVSDASAENYLDELEKEGKIRQVGKTGRSVEYELNG